MLQPKTIYLFRHGETDYNRLNRFQGGLVDPPLNEEGRAQVAAFFTKYGTIPFDLVLSSRLQRSMQSVLPFLSSDSLHISSGGLNEISWGMVDGQICSGPLDRSYRRLKRRWTHGNLNARFPDGESPAQVRLRQQPITRRILDGPERRILIAAHGRAMRIWLADLIDRDLTRMERYDHANTSLYVLNVAVGETRIALFNDRSHLDNRF